MYVLGVNLSHDRSACLVSDAGDIVAIAEERLDRQKHSCPLDRLNRLFAVVPQRSVNYCLEARGIGFDDLDAVVFCNAAIVGGNVVRNLSVADCATQMPWSPHSYLATINHHEAHALSAFVPSGFDEAVVLVVDKGGSVWDWWRNERGVDVPLIERVSVYRASRNGLELLTKIHDRHGDMLWNCNSVGALYELATLQIGCTPFDAGKTMGLAPYGRTVYADAFKRQLELNAGGFQISPTVQSVGQHLFPKYFAGRYGPVNPQPERPSQHYADLARAAQEAVEDIMVHLAREAHAMTGLPRLCIAGGLGLNCVANSRIEESTPFEQIFVQPAATDDGTALGAAFHGLSLLGTRFPQSAPWHAALGRAYSAAEIDHEIAQHPSLAQNYAETPRAEFGDVVRVLSDGGVVGWFDGGSEFGPRALGHRSLLADPRPARMREFLNGEVKHREQYRPYGASVLAEHANAYFELRSEQPFMLFVSRVHPERQSEAPSIVHVDGTCRVQTVTRERDPNYHGLISEFAAQTGLPFVLNTSFNGKSEPIVETPAHAIASAISMKLDALYLNGRLFVRRQAMTRFKQWENGPWLRCA